MRTFEVDTVFSATLGHAKGRLPIADLSWKEPEEYCR